MWLSPEISRSCIGASYPGEVPWPRAPVRSRRSVQPIPSRAASAFSSQKSMPISRYIAAAVVRCSSRLSEVAGPASQRSEAEVAVGDERAHLELGGAGRAPADSAHRPRRRPADRHGTRSHPGAERPGLVAPLAAPARDRQGLLRRRPGVLRLAGEQVGLAQIARGRAEYIMPDPMAPRDLRVVAVWSSSARPSPTRPMREDMPEGPRMHEHGPRSCCRVRAPSPRSSRRMAWLNSPLSPCR